MSNLSELLPAGAGAKSAKFVASGTLPSGQTVALKSNGQVAAVSATGIPAAIGAEEVFNSATTASQRITMLTSTKAIVVYQDTGNSSYGTACILTVSGSTITAGTEVVFESASSNYLTVVSFTETQALVVYGDTGNSGIGTYCLLTISGSTITAATPVAFMAGSFGFPDSAKFSATQAIVAYMDGGNSSTYAASLFTLSGTSISVGTAFQFDAVTGWLSSVSKLTATQAIVAYRGGSNYGTSVVLTISGTSFTKGTSVVFNSAATNSLGSDTLTATQAIVAFRNSGNSYYGTSCVLNVSGTTVTVGSPVVFETADASHIGLSVLTSTRAAVAYADVGNSGKGTYCTLDVSGSTVTAGTPIVYNPTVGNSLANSTAALTTSAFLVAYGDTGNSSYGTSIFIQTEGSNSADFIGITDEAIANTASGSVIVQGGVITNTGLIPLGPVAGAESVFDSDTTYLTATVYDSNSNKIVVTYSDSGNSSYGTAVVGTVSGTSISFGTAAIFYSGALDGLSMVFDSSNNKVVAAYRAGSNSYHGYGVVGTVSGTSISFGTPVVFEAASVASIVTTFDSNLNKVVIAYQDNGNSGHGTAIVGTVSGTSISFGTAVVFEADSSNNMAATFDSNSNKAVIAYRDNGSGVGGLGTAIVGTVSGTSISFGTAAVYSGTGAAADQAMTFDSSSNKVVVAYADGGNSSYGTAVVGTVSGTAISFGTAVVYNASSSSAQAATFDSNLNKVIIAYRRSSPNEGNVSVGTVSGTSISFGNAATFNAANTAYTSMAFDTTNNKTVIAYRDSGDGNKGTSVVINLTSNLAIASDYFVQTNGSISTTSSTVPAGRALSTTSMLLEG